MFKWRFFLTAAVLLLTFGLISCEHDTTPPSAFDANNMPAIWTADQMQDYLAKFEYPDDPNDLRIQFYNHKHRSQLRPDELAILEAREQKFRDRRLARSNGVRPDPELPKYELETVSSYFFWETDYDSREWGEFDDAATLWDEAGITWDSGESVWWINCGDQTSTTDVVNAQDYLDDECFYSDFTNLISSDPGVSACPISIGGNIIQLFKRGIGSEFGLLGSGEGREFAIDVDAGYVYTNLNPSLESWTSGVPDAFQINPSSPDNVPTGWDVSYFGTNYLTQDDTYEEIGSYCAELYMAQRPNVTYGNNMTTGYFDVPSDYEGARGTWEATVMLSGDPDGAQIHFGIALFNDSQGLLDSDIAWADFLPTSAGTYGQAVVQASSGAYDIHHVRFVVRQSPARTPGRVYVDHFALSCPYGDVSLPVNWYGPDFEAELDYNNDEVTCDWTTHAEVQNLYWKLFWRDGGIITPASDDQVLGQGSTSNTTYYTNEDFELTLDAEKEVQYEGEITVFMGCVDYYGVWDYFEGDAITLEENR